MNNLPTKIYFDNTQYAFAYKTDGELKKAHFLFKTMGSSFLLNLGLTLMPMAIRFRIPFTKSLIRQTIFSQFVGGETLEETAKVADKLEQYHVQVILDYGVEGGQGEAAFDHATDEFIRVIQYASSQANIPFMSIKITGIARFGLMEKIDSLMHQRSGTLIKRYQSALEALTPDEQSEWKRTVARLEKICGEAVSKNIGVLVDAEETWIQDPVDAITLLMMDSVNKEKCYIYNTYQLYRHDRLAFLQECHEAATQRGFILGAKLVRGAYMEKERQRASDLGYPSPIQPDKETCDADYNAALQFCMNDINRIALIVASHNEYSNLYTTQLMEQANIAPDHPHVHFSQLYGMSDNITFNLANSGFSVSKYLPFGPIRDVVPYLMRRAQENSSVAGQTGRELGLIEKELRRRKGQAG